MSDEFETSDSNSEESDSLAKLLKLAGPRAEIPRGIEMRIYDRVRRDWKASIQQPDSSKIYKKVRRAWKRDGRLDVLMRWTLPLGGVAAAVIAILVLIQPPPPPIVAVATVSKVIAAATANSRYTEAMTVHTGDSIITGDGEGLSLLLTRSESLRVDENTELRVDARDRFTLLSGRVYVDTGQFVYRDGDLTIETAFGSVTDVGTQFAVSARDQHLDVAVREGRVDIANDNTEFAVMMGERFTLGHDDGGSISSLRANDEYWNWVADLAPASIRKTHRCWNFLNGQHEKPDVS